MNRTTLLAALCATSLLAACGSDEHDDHAEQPHDHEALAEDACHHAEEAPIAVAASADPAAAANAVSTTHQAYTVQLPEQDGQHAGAVLFTPDEAGEFAFFTSTAVALAIFDGEAQVAIEETEAIDACPGVLSTMHVADLELGTQYTLVIGPTADAEVTLLTVHAADDGHAAH